MDEIDSASLRGRQVIDNKGKNIGSVNDIAIDPSSWRVRGLIVDIEREVAENLHMDKPIFSGKPRLEIGTERVEALGDNVILNVDTDQIAGLLRRSG